MPFLDDQAIVLFDSGASHSFIFESFAKKCHLETITDNKEWNIRIPTGENRITTLICEKSPITLGHLVLLADLIVLDMRDFDIILGMDWLSKHYAFIDCRSKKSNL